MLHSRSLLVISFIYSGRPHSAVKNPLATQELQETRVQSLGWEDPLEEGMATPSNILALRLPWTEEPDSLQSMGLQRVEFLVLCSMSLLVINFIYSIWSFPGGSVVKNLSANAGDAGDSSLIPGLGGSPGGKNGNLLQYSCLEKSHGQRRLAGYGAAKSWTQLSDRAHTHTHTHTHTTHTVCICQSHSSDLSLPQVFFSCI